MENEVHIMNEDSTGYVREKKEKRGETKNSCVACHQRDVHCRGNFAIQSLPTDFDDHASKGHAFINFLTAELARDFAYERHPSWHPNLWDETGRGLNVASATQQGLEANVRR